MNCAQKDQGNVTTPKQPIWKKNSILNLFFQVKACHEKGTKTLKKWDTAIVENPKLETPHDVLNSVYDTDNYNTSSIVGK